ncbi:MAG: NAD(P)H-dependent oxidoreductase [Nocardioides sp.]
MRIGIIVGSTRPGRKGAGVGAWVHEIASRRDDAEFELVDLADYDLVLLDEETVPSDAHRNYASAATRRWSAKIDELDGFVWVTPEYNHGVPAALKNALDVLWPEWGNKTVGFVAYGFDGGTRSVEQWRMIVAAAFMIAVRPQVALQNFADFDGNRFTPQDRRERELTSLLDHLVRMTEATASLRS